MGHSTLPAPKLALLAGRGEPRGWLGTPGSISARSSAEMLRFVSWAMIGPRTRPASIADAIPSCTDVRCTARRSRFSTGLRRVTERKSRAGILLVPPLRRRG